MWNELLTFLFLLEHAAAVDVDLLKSFMWGPGLQSTVTLPVRYFVITPVDKFGQNITEPLRIEEQLKLTITSNGEQTRTWHEVLNNHDGSYLVRYRHYGSYDGQTVEVTLDGQHVGKSPYHMKGSIYHENCDCPEPRIEQWYEALACPSSYTQVDRDFQPFPTIDMEEDVEKIFSKFSRRGAHSLVHYSIVDNKIYSRTRGKHVDFQMFSDSILTSLTRKVRLPDVEFVVNLGDWPLERSSSSSGPPLPIISWCGSTDTSDIVIPTYEITEAALEMLGRVSLDLFSVLNASSVPWADKKDKAFFRGRDSSEERIELVKLSRDHPDLIDARLTHVFFFRDRLDEIGELVPRISFFDFFKYKYQISMDGTVAAYRLPLLLVGNSLIFKQDSKYYEHFYGDLEPYVHYIPIKRDISDLLEKLEWARDHDDKAQEIVANAQRYAREKLDPKSIYCYHARVLEEYAKRQVSKPKIYDDMKLVRQPESDCRCHRAKIHDEL